MEIINFDKKYNSPIALALGYFDSVHNGHKLLVDSVVASEFMPAVFTFKNNPQAQLGGTNKQCYTFEERVDIFERLGVKMIINAVFDKSFMNTSAQGFLNTLVQNFNIKFVVIGNDYTCGKNAEFKKDDIVSFFKTKNIEVKVIDLLMENGSKIASRNIRELIKEGKVEDVNKLLPFDYHINGVVQKGRNVGGSVVGYPTANVAYPYDKIEIKAGVYKTQVRVDNAEYLAITNVGTHPTFDDYNFNIETFVFDYDGDLYGKNIQISFLKYIREIVKFENAIELKTQIDKDIQKIKEVKND